MTKKIISVILVLVLTLGCFCITNTVYADSDLYGDEALQHIINLGILPSSTDGEDLITRGQFAQAVYNIAGDNVVLPFELLYYDVDEADSCSGAVMYCSKNGYMIGSDHIFRADDSITFIEAMTVLSRVLNYTDYAKNHGDYTLGYYTTAKNIGLLNGTGITSANDAMDAKNCAAMFYNALKIGMNKLSSISPIYYTYQASGKIFAYEKLGLNFAKGIMQSNGYVDITGKENSGEKSVIIDNTRYSSKLLDDSFRFLIGQEVSVFYDDDLNVVSIATTGTSNVVNVKKENFVERTGNTFKYIVDGKVYKLEAGNKAIYFKNGEVVMGYNATGFKNAEYADITFVDGDGDDRYDYVFVNEYKTFVVSNASNDEMLYSTDNTKKVDISEESQKDIFVYNSVGELKSIEDINSNYVVSVIENKDFVYIVYSNSLIKGEIQEKDDYAVIVDGITVDIPNGTSKLLKNLKAGDYASIYMDFSERGVFATKIVETNSNAPYGYLVEGFFKNDFDKKIKLRIYNNSGELKFYNVAKNFSVDGKRIKLSSLKDLPAEFYGVDGSFKSTVVFYELNSQNEIISIEFPKTELAADEDGFLQTADSITAYKLSNGTITNRDSDDIYFSSKEFLNSNSVIFVIPEKKEDEEKFAIIKEADISESTDFVWDFYHFSKYNGYVDVAVMHTDYAALSYDTSLSVVVSVSEKLDADGIERVAIKHSANGVEYVSMADEGFEISEYVYKADGTKSASKIKITDLKPGDAVRFTTDKNGIIRFGERIYEYNATENPFKGSSKSGDYSTAALYTGSGYTAYNDKSMLRVADTKDECNTVTHSMFDLTGIIYSSAQITMVEETERGVKAYMGTADDIGIGDFIVYQSRSGVGKYVIVYKDK